MQRKTLFVCALFLIAALIAAFLPVFCVTLVPEWKIRLVTPNGTLAIQVPLQESWNENLGTEANFGAVDECRRADAEVIFPSRKLCGVSLAGIILAKAEDAFIGFGSPGSLDPVARITCCGGHKCEAYYFDGGALPAQMVVSNSSEMGENPAEP